MSRSIARRLLTLLALVLSIAALLRLVPTPVTAQTPPRQVFRGGANLVTVDVYPRRDGRIIEGLTAADFEVLEDGVVQTVDQFDFVQIDASPESERHDPNSQSEGLGLASDPRRRAFVIFLDTYHVGVQGSHDIRGPLSRFIDRALGPTDVFAVTTPKQSSLALTFGRKTQSIEDQLTRYWDWGETARYDPDNPAETNLIRCFGDGPDSRELIARYREDLTLRKLGELAQVLGQIRETRTTMIVVSDGWTLFKPRDAGAGPARAPAVGVLGGRLGVIDRLDSRTGQPTPASCEQARIQLLSIDGFARLRDVIAHAQQNNVVFYPVSPRGLVASPSGPGAGAMSANDTLRSLSGETGGLAIVDSNDLAGGLARIAADTSAYYLLGYYSKATRNDGRAHRIVVRVKQPGAKVSARRGYRSPTAEEAAATEALNRPAPETSRPILEAMSHLPDGRNTLPLFTYGSEWGSSGALAIVAELASSTAASPPWATGATIDVTVTGEGGEDLGTTHGTLAAGARSTLVKVPVKDNPGAWRVTVRMRGSGGDVLTERLVVAPSGAAVLGDPVGFRATPASQSPLHPVADFVFRRTERLHVEWPVLAAVTQRSAQLLDVRGNPIDVAMTLSDRTDGALKMLVADLNLAALGPGDYIVHVTAATGADSEEKYLAIRVGG